MAMAMRKPSAEQYFYGRITREEAELFLNERGCEEGLYLLRESINPLGNYAVSICHNKNVHHYAIEKKYDGRFMIAEGKSFPGPVELIEHHKVHLDGFVTKPVKPCNRLPFQPPIAFRGMTYTDLENELLTKAESMKKVKMETALGAQREHLIVLVAKDLHLKMPWFHGRISRDEADKRLTNSGHHDGKFLVRVRDDKKTFALTVSWKGDTRHYMIEKRDKFHILGGPKFDCIMMMVDHYHNKSDGLLCKLTVPCPAPNYDQKLLKKYMENSHDNTAYASHDFQASRRAAETNASANDVTPRSPTNPIPVKRTPSLSVNRPLPKTPSPSRADDVPNIPAPLPPSRPPPHPVLPAQYSGNWDDDPDDVPALPSRENSMRVMNGINNMELEKIYDTVPRNEQTFTLKRNQIKLDEENLGAGQFGSVKKGECRVDGKTIPVAVKTLKNEDVSAKDEMMKEARFMSNLEHKHIVRMIGVCDAECIMLVLELCPGGPLNTYLKHHKDTPQSTIAEIMWQVAQGMAYLQKKNFVHRDLAARNVLLVHEHLAKISDFGMSKAVGREHNYYEAKEAGKWPLKWYAPECVYYWKFDNKSDVWSYGVTLWEATSYGDKPYRRMKGQEILKFLVEEERRLQKPDKCPDMIYELMLNCWEYEKEKRPTFVELEQRMEYAYNVLIEQRI